MGLLIVMVFVPVADSPEKAVAPVRFKVDVGANEIVEVLPALAFVVVKPLTVSVPPLKVKVEFSYLLGALKVVVRAKFPAKVKLLTDAVKAST